MTVIRWGISSTGYIAGEFARALAEDPGSLLLGVASRTEARARQFAEEHGAQGYHASIASLVMDPDIDIVYVASPTSAHVTDALCCLRAGKPVLVEKPLAGSAADVRRLVHAARQADTFLMEAIWPRFLPVYRRVGELVAAGVVGDVAALRADLGFTIPERDEVGELSRVYCPDLGGGALLDLGVYPLQLAQMLFGIPAHVDAVSAYAASGVDTTTMISLGYAGATVTAQVSIRSTLSNSAEIIGSRGAINLPAPHHAAQHVTVTADAGHAVAAFEEPIIGHYLGYQLRHTNRCLREGRTESPLLTLEESLALAQTIQRAAEAARANRRSSS